MKEVILSAVVGALLAVWVGNITSRRDRLTKASSRIFELRIEAFNRVWLAFNDMKGWFVRRLPMNPSEWKAKYRSEAGSALDKFRRTIDESQIVLPADAIEVLRKIDAAYAHYFDDEQENGDAFHKKIKEFLDELSTVANRTMSTHPHTIRLQFLT
jgi:hypothetical protein